jgi:acyl carrier protein
MTTEDRVRTFILEELQFVGEPTELTSDYELIESGAIDSLGIYSLTEFIEEELGVEIADEELLPENFSTIAAIAQLVDSKAR